MGLAKAQAALNRQKKEALRLQAEQEVLKSMAEERENRAARAARAVGRERGDRISPDFTGDGPAESRMVSDLVANVRSHTRVIDHVATRSSNLKGTFQRVLKDAVMVINETTDLLSKRTATEEVRALQADNISLKSKIEHLSEEVIKLSAELQAIRRDSGGRGSTAIRPGPSDMEVEDPDAGDSGSSGPRLPTTRRKQPKRAAQEIAPSHLDVKGLTEAIMAQVEALLDARLPGSRANVSLPAGEHRSSQSRERRGGKGGTKGPKRAPPSQTKTPGGPGPSPAGAPVSGPPAASKRRDASRPPPPPEPSEVPWSKVVGRKRGGTQKATEGGKGKAKVPARTSAGAKGAPRQGSNRRPLRPPRTAAVSLTCIPGGDGCTLPEAMVAAKREIRLEDLGIPSIRPRLAITGGLLLEIAGEDRAAKADALAEKMKEALRDRGIKVSRPSKASEVRVSGLGISATVAEVQQAISAVAEAEGGGQISVGRVGRMANGLGAVLVRCPMTVAKKLEESGHLMVGWVRARVEVLRPRPLRCYRCLEGTPEWRARGSTAAIAVIAAASPVM